MEISQLLEQELQLLHNKILSNAQVAGKKVTGKTIASLESLVVKKSDSVNATISAAPWFFTLEHGRGPAKGKASGSDFLQNLKSWIQTKGIPVADDNELERLAKFLKWRINTSGTRQYRQGAKTDIYTQAIDDFKNNIPQKVKELYINQIKNML